MVTKKSIYLNILQHIFLDGYIKQKYSNKIHSLEYKEIVLYNSYGSHVPKVALADYFKPQAYIDIDNLKELEPYIVKYRNTAKRYTFFKASVYEGTPSLLEGHSFFFIYDKNDNTVSEFTSKEDYNIQHRKLIKTFFERVYSHNVKIIFEDWDRLLESKYLKYFNCSLFDHDDKNDFFDKNQAYSVIWVLWFLERVLTNPNLTMDEIKLKHREFFHDAQKQICKIAETYARFVDQIQTGFKIIYPKRKILQSASLKLVQHLFNRKENWVWHGDSDKGNLFLDVYIKKKYTKKLHILPYIEIVLYNSYDKNNKLTRKAMLADYSKPKVHIDLEDYKKLDPYINKYRNTAKRYTFYNMSVYHGEPFKKEGHSFFFIYDKKNNVVTRFDSEEHFAVHSTKSIKTFFEIIYPDNIKVLFGNYENVLGIQVIHNVRCMLFDYDETDSAYKHQEYSMVWSFWFLEMILTNPKLTIDQVKTKANSLLFESKELICKIAAGYSQFIDKTISKHKTIYPRTPQKSKA